MVEKEGFNILIQHAMPIIRIQKRENPYVQIDRAALEDNRLSWKARGILAYLLSKPDDWSIHLFDIINHGTDGRDAVQGALKELEKFGYAKLELVRNENGQVGGKEWVICEAPTDGFSVRRSSPTDGKTDVGKTRQSENPLYSNNNKGSNNKHTARKSKPSNGQLPTDAGALPNFGYTFEMFWNDYAHKVGSKAKAEKAFAKLSEADRGAIRDTLEMYKRDTVTNDAWRGAGNFKALRQHPLTYLNGRVWETYLDRKAQVEQPTEFDEAYQVYIDWVERNYAHARRTCANFSKAQFIEFKRTSKADIIGKESENKFLKVAHETAREKDAWTIYQKLVNDRLEARRV